MTSLTRQTLRRLGKSAGSTTFEGAMQRLEQGVANFQEKNDHEPGQEEIFRRHARNAFIARVKIEFADILNAPATPDQDDAS